MELAEFPEVSEVGFPGAAMMEGRLLGFLFLAYVLVWLWCCWLMVTKYQAVM